MAFHSNQSEWFLSSGILFLTQHKNIQYNSHLSELPFLMEQFTQRDHYLGKIQPNSHVIPINIPHGKYFRSFQVCEWVEGKEIKLGAQSMNNQLNMPTENYWQVKGYKWRTLRYKSSCIHVLEINIIIHHKMEKKSHLWNYFWNWV